MVLDYRLFILDYDLTIMDNLYDFYLSIAGTLRDRFGVNLCFREFYELLIRDELQDFVNKFVRDGEVFWREMRFRICKTHGLTPSNGVELFLKFVKKMGSKVAVVSGRECHSKHIVLDLEKSGLIDYIDGVYTLYDLYVNGGVEKYLFDKSWIIRYVCKQFNVSPQEAVYIGDYHLDYRSSLEAGVKFIGVSKIRERRLGLVKAGARVVVEDFNEVLTAVSSTL